MNWWALLPLAGAAALGAVLLRRWPLPALGLLLAGSAAIRQIDVRLQLAATLLPILLTGLVVCYCAATRSVRRSITAAVLSIGVQVYVILDGAVLFLHPFGRPASPLVTSQVVTATLTTIIAWLIGHLIRQGNAHAEALRAQAQAQAVTSERLRIARELHDMVAHSIGVIAIQAGVGSRVISTQPAEAQNALSAIEATSRETLSGLRRMLGMLRAGPGDDPPWARPEAPGLASLRHLAETAKDAGVRVDIQWDGHPCTLPAEIDLSAFRIIQEALTNVIRHSGAGHCQVLIGQHDEELSIQVTDDGRGGVIPATGYGIAGMRERAALLGGQLTAGPRPGGGFRVTARLPVYAGVQ